MSLHGFLLSGEVTKVLSHVGVRVGLRIDVFSDSEQVVLSLLDLDIVSSDGASEVNVSSFGLLDVLSEVVAVLRNSVDILSQSDALDVLLGVEVLHSGDFSLVVLEGN